MIYQEQTTISASSKNLTEYLPASIKEIWSIAFPLMLTALSANLMIFLDRVILANYSTAAMDAAAIAGIVCAIFQFGIMAIASVTEIFVGQYNGAEQPQHIGESVWQMIWFSVMTAILFLPLALFFGDYLLPQINISQSKPYFQWLMFFGPLYSLISALSGFYIGIGKTKLVVIASIIANVLNLTLAIILVHGIVNIIPAMGTLGAAIATVTSITINAIILSVVFLNAYHRKTYGTSCYQFKPPLFWKSLKVGFPLSISHQIELAAWAFLFYLLAKHGSEFITVAVIGQSVFILFSFATEGLSRGVTGVAANYIGAQQFELVKKTLRSSLIIFVCFMIILTFPLIIYPEIISKIFLNNSELSQSGHLSNHIRSMLFWIWVAFIFDGIAWILAGIVSAAGDTKFIMLVNMFNIWLFAILPIYVIVFVANGSSSAGWRVFWLYSLLNMCFFYWRYKKKKWSTIKLISTN